jgi:hypothetical protein
MAQTLLSMDNVLFNMLKFLSNQTDTMWQDRVFRSTLNGNNFYILFPPRKNTMGDLLQVPRVTH